MEFNLRLVRKRLAERQRDGRYAIVLRIGEAVVVVSRLARAWIHAKYLDRAARQRGVSGLPWAWVVRTDEQTEMLVQIMCTLTNHHRPPV